jgi:hypothetical protein
MVSRNKPGFFAVAETKEAYSFDNPQLYTSKYQDNWCNNTQTTTDYGGSVTGYGNADLQYDNVEMLDTALPVYNTPTANAPWNASTNEDAFNTTACDADTIWGRVPAAVKTVKIKALAVKQETEKGLIRREKKEKSDAKKAVRVLQTMSFTTGTNIVIDPNPKQTRVSFLNARSAMKHRTRKMDRMVFLRRENERLDKENSALVFENTMQILCG